MSHKIHNKGQARLFKNVFLEALTKTHPIVIISMYVPLAIYLLYHFHTHVESSLLLMGSLFAAGLFFWTFTEYMLHRYVFHFVNDTPLVQRIHYFVHGVHHEYPRDTDRLIMPPVPSIIIACLFFFTFHLLMGDYAYGFFPGFLIGYLAYALMHYALHAIKPPFEFMKPLWRNHSLHHYKTPDKGFGVSSPLWDHIFGTVPAKDELDSK